MRCLVGCITAKPGFGVPAFRCRRRTLCPGQVAGGHARHRRHRRRAAGWVSAACHAWKRLAERRAVPSLPALQRRATTVHSPCLSLAADRRQGGTTWALTADAHGRLMAHNLSRHLSVAASAISSFARERLARRLSAALSCDARLPRGKCRAPLGNWQCWVVRVCLFCVSSLACASCRAQVGSRAAAAAAPATSSRCSRAPAAPAALPLIPAPSAACCRCTAAAPPGCRPLAGPHSSTSAQRQQRRCSLR
jgi:hypothetical protein